MNVSGFRDRLLERAEHVGLSVPADVLSKLENYFRLLVRWDRKINLTGLDLAAPSAEAIDRLFIEPLLAVSRVPAHARRMIDIGSGGGSPALPMVLALPQLSLVLVESRARKAVFLREAVRGLELATADVVGERFETLFGNQECETRHDLLTIRAVRTDARVLSQIQRFVRPGGLLFLFRGADGPPAALPQMLAFEDAAPLSAESKLLILRKI